VVTTKAVSKLGTSTLANATTGFIDPMIFCLVFRWDAASCKWTTMNCEGQVNKDPQVGNFILLMHRSVWHHISTGHFFVPWENFVGHEVYSCNKQSLHFL
jgi:hypothetical protein